MPAAAHGPALHLAVFGWPAAICCFCCLSDAVTFVVWKRPRPSATATTFSAFLRLSILAPGFICGFFLAGRVITRGPKSKKIGMNWTDEAFSCRIFWTTALKRNFPPKNHSWDCREYLESFLYLFWAIFHTQAHLRLSKKLAP